MDKIRFFTLGGNDEDGKNISVLELNDDIYVIDAGVRYPEGEFLGVEYIIPDFSYLVARKDRVKGVFLTHAHDDVMGAITFLLKEVKAPVYTTAFTALVLEDKLKEEKIKNIKINRIKRNAHFKVDGRKVFAFGLTHSIQDTIGFAFDTDQGYVIHTAEYVFDFDVRYKSFGSDVSVLAELGKKGVFMMTVESVGAKRPGFTSPSHRISDRIERVFEDTNDRIIISLYDQNIYRLIEVIEMANRFNRKIYFYNENQRKLMRHLEKLRYYNMPAGLELSDRQFSNDMENVLVIVSDVGPNVFRTLNSIAIGGDKRITLRESDTVIIGSPIVPGTEVEAGAMENELFKEGVNIHSLNYKEVYSMHASEEDIKMMLYLLKPKFVVPVKGEFQNLVANANIALDLGIQAKNIVVLDNGQVATFENGELAGMQELIKLEEVLIDGNDHLDSGGLVLRDRKTLATDGAIIVGMVIDHKTKEILGGPDVQSRGVIYLKDADNIVKEVGAILERTIEQFVKDNKYDNMSARNEARDQISRFMYKETGKRPMILPVIIEINTQ